MSSIVSEFEQFSEPEGTFSDLLFIENFPSSNKPVEKEIESNGNLSTAVTK